MQSATDIDMLNREPSDDPLFEDVIASLSRHLDNDELSDIERESCLDGLATTARMLGRQKDDIAEWAYRELVKIDPDYSAYHYNLGLFYKTRGRFAEGMAANQQAASLSDEPVESTEWNLGICATGAREGAVALEVWQRMGQKIEMGQFDLPEGGYGSCKVRLAERPLAERNKDNDSPGLEESIWIQRLSPSHGIIRSVLYQDLGIDYGDVVLIDGAPITYHRYGDREVPVFPHLATLVRRHYQIFDFAGTQDEAGRLSEASESLEQDAVIYSHTEQFVSVCASCWRDPDTDHAGHDDEERHVVRGRIAIPPDVDLKTFVDQLDAAMAGFEPCQLYAPDLCRAAGLDTRAAHEQRRFDMLCGNTSA